MPLKHSHQQVKNKSDTSINLSGLQNLKLNSNNPKEKSNLSNQSRHGTNPNTNNNNAINKPTPKSRESDHQRIDSTRAYSIVLDATCCSSLSTRTSTLFSSGSSIDSILSDSYNNNNNNQNNSSNTSSNNSGGRNHTSKLGRIADHLERTANLNELVQLIRSYIRKIEKNLSLDTLHDYLVRNYKRTSNKPINFKSLEAHLAEQNSHNSNSNTSPSSMGYNGKDSGFNSTSRLNFQSKRTFSQVKKTHQTSHKGDGNWSRNARPVEKLLKNLAIFRKLFEIVQRDLLYDLLEFEMPSLEHQNSNLFMSPSTIQMTTSIMLLKDESNMSLRHPQPVQNAPRPTSKNSLLHNLNQIDPGSNLRAGSFLSDYQQLKSNAVANKSSLSNSAGESRSSLVKRIDKNTKKILDLNEKLAMLLNDESTSDLKLLSSHSCLPSSKSETCKHGEFVLRFSFDVAYKLKFLLKLCEKNYELFYVLFNNNSTTQLVSPSFILKKITRKRAQQQQQFGNTHQNEQFAPSNNNNANGRLPRIGSHHLNKTFMINEANGSQTGGEKVSESSDEIPGEAYGYTDSVEPTNSDVEIERELNDENDGSDSFIQVNL
jgi:hypothetical protein